MTIKQIWEQFLEKDHKIKPKVWQARGLSFDAKYLYIPYFGDNGDVLFTKRRKEPSFKGDNKYLYPKGSKISLYPTTDLTSSEVWFLAEGELDALTLESYGLPAVTAGGVTGFKKEFNDYFKGKKVLICFDNDKPGKDNAEKIAKRLTASGIEAAIIDLPDMKEGKDIGDYFRLGHSKKGFMVLLKSARPIKSDDGDAGTDNRDGIEEPKLLPNAVTYQEVEDKVRRLLPNSRVALKLVLAVAVSCMFPNPQMLWLLLVGVPSSGKTDIVRLIKDSETTYYLDNLTQNAFISGERATKSQRVHDLLPLLNGKCLIIKDWTSIFSLDEHMTKKLLGDLVNIYDKEFTKFSSRRGNVSYASIFSQLGCITPATLNRHTNYMNMIGPRFLCYTVPTSTYGDLESSYEMIFSNIDRSLLEKEARMYASSYLTQLSQQQMKIKPMIKPTQNYLRVAATLMSYCRGIVILQAASFKNDEGEEVKYYEVSDIQVEEPWRAIQQLKELAKYLAFVVGKNEIGIQELEIIKEVVISSMPADRSQALRSIKEVGGEITAKILSDASDRSTKTARRLLDELSALKVVNKIRGAIVTDYSLNEKFRDFILLDTTQFMSQGTETPYGIQEEVQISDN